MTNGATGSAVQTSGCAPTCAAGMWRCYGIGAKIGNAYCGSAPVTNDVQVEACAQLGSNTILDTDYDHDTFAASDGSGNALEANLSYSCGELNLPATAGSAASWR